VHFAGAEPERFVSSETTGLDGKLTSLFAAEYLHTISKICLGICDISPAVVCSAYWGFEIMSSI